MPMVRFAVNYLGGTTDRNIPTHFEKLIALSVKIWFAVQVFQMVLTETVVLTELLELVNSPVTIVPVILYQRIVR